MRLLPALTVALAIVVSGCDTDRKAQGVGAGVVGPSLPFSVDVFPSALSFQSPLGVSLSGCPSVVPLVTNLQLIVVAGSTDLTFDSAGFNLINGTHVGGPSLTSPLTFSRSDLIRMFSTV